MPPSTTDTRVLGGPQFVCGHYTTYILVARQVNGLFRCPSAERSPGSLVIITFRHLRRLFFFTKRKIRSGLRYKPSRVQSFEASESMFCDDRIPLKSQQVNSKEEAAVSNHFSPMDKTAGGVQSGFFFLTTFGHRVH